jgi:sterol desaturase/sphingolipid hydroxylase (fatty acid hydroxylase superfamily)
MLIKYLSDLIIFLTFIALLGWTMIHQINQLKIKPIEDWLIDTIGLTIQGIVIPLLQTSLIYQLYQYLLPNYHSSLKLSLIPTFLISFCLIDYLYYWNHRLLHSQLFWPIHQVHHTVTDMDVFGTSRNTIWTSFLIIYLWIHPLFLYLLINPLGYLLGIALTSALDLWRHSSLDVNINSKIYQILSPWLILPQDHAWHHCSKIGNYNYGANLKIWDRLHKTYYSSQTRPDQIGVETSLNFIQKLFFPFKL